MTRYRRRDPRVPAASNRGRQTETPSRVRQQAPPWHSRCRQSACGQNPGQGATCGGSSASYADIGIRSIMPRGGLCRVRRGMPWHIRLSSGAARHNLSRLGRLAVVRSPKVARRGRRGDCRQARRSNDAAKSGPNPSRQANRKMSKYSRRAEFVEGTSPKAPACPLVDRNVVNRRSPPTRKLRIVKQLSACIWIRLRAR